MPKYKMLIAYDGTGFGGWQSQSNAVSIQDVIEKALSTVLRLETKITGSGRTDAGVHARGQVAHFLSQSLIDTNKILYSLNSMIPKEIRILDISLVNEEFHARFSAKSKCYYYHIHLDPIADPFKRQYSLYVQHRVDIEAMKTAASYLIGTHDFTSFANEQHRGCASKDAVRTLYRLDIVEETGGIRLEFEGSGFLYKMVRNITGTLLEVGKGKRLAQDIPLLLAAKDRQQAGKAADPHGLFLMQVNYSV
ncbi:MAG: tRNA pseudouridine(38-40) synthase TruA [Chlamydiae bacterium]|nr:tRNA pseudouridine(38-40) synthase TruA [Chlamydiota bacterium]